MRKVLKSTAEVCHYWANAVQSQGKAGNVFFIDQKIYSYGHHFVIARRLDSGVAIFTTQRYSSSTNSHISQARSAARHLDIVFCNDPDSSAMSNKDTVMRGIVDALDNSEKPRIRQTTRDSFKADALRLAEGFNAYLHVLPDAEKQNVSRIDTTGLAHIREVMQENERKAREARQARELLENQETAERLTAWRIDPTIRTDGFYRLPVALRLHTLKPGLARNLDNVEINPGAPDKVIIQTSHGAEIPVSFAPYIWRLVGHVKASGQPVEHANIACGHYKLNTVRADGSIVVGCHDIPYAELERIAGMLGYVSAVETV